MCQSTILSHRGRTTVSYCAKCLNHYIWQSSFILTFTPYQFDCFLQEIKGRRGKETFINFPDGEERLVLTTPLDEMLLTFSNEEWTDFNCSLDDAFYLRQIQEMLNR